MFNKSALKNDLKVLADLIHKQKELLKDCQRRTGQAGEWEGQPGYSKYFAYSSDHLRSKREFRHKHIAYCLLRGRAMEQIEIPAKENQPDMDLIERIKNEYSLDDVRACAA